MSEMSERHGLVLGELSELGLTLARDLHARALAAETADDAEALALAFHRLSRSVRQTLALEAKLERDRLRADREAEIEARKEAARRIDRRKSQARLVVERLIWTEAEDDEAEHLLIDLSEALDVAALDDDFEAIPLDALIAKITKALGLTNPAHPGESGDPSGAADLAEPTWRSSA